MSSYQVVRIPFPLQEICSIPDSLAPLPAQGFREQSPKYTRQKQKILMHSLTTTPKTTKETHFTVAKLNGKISQSAVTHRHSLGEGEMKTLLGL